MKASPVISIPRATPLLPNSSPEVLKERRNAQGALQVSWIPQIDAHGLFCTWLDGAGTTLLATHNNGHSCSAQADRICAGDLSGAGDQRDFITACGGTACSPGILQFVVTGHTDVIL